MEMSAGGGHGARAAGAGSRTAPRAHAGAAPAGKGPPSTVHCRMCGSPSAAGHRFCEACGYELQPDTVAPPVAERPVPRGTGESGSVRSEVSGREPSSSGLSGRAGRPARLCGNCRTPSVGSDGWCSECGRPYNPRDRVEIDLGPAAGVSDRGHRHLRNEDALALRVIRSPQLGRAVVAVVCDGVSSSPRPDEASATASATACRTMASALRSGATPEKATEAGTAAAAAAVARLTGTDADGNCPACTFVSAVVTADAVTVGWVGDSRAYWLTGDGEPQLLTEDDSWAVRMIALGILTAEQAYADRRAHAIVSWLGADAGEVRARTATIRPTGPGVVLLCSDGLWNYVPGAEDLCRAALPGAYGQTLDTARELTARALDSGGADNITVALVPYPPPAPETSQPLQDPVLQDDTERTITRGSMPPADPEGTLT